MTHTAAPLPKLVFLEAGEHEPYTTDKIIAECAQVKRKVVSDLIRRYKTDLESFGILRFKNAKIISEDGRGRPKKLYHLNEQQATLLITYLRNTEPVKAFKKALVKEFYAMRAELTKRRELRAEGKPQRRSLTDMIRDNPEANRWDYKLYTDLAYKAAFGKTAAQIRKERAPGSKRRAVDLLTADELTVYQKQENAVASLYAVGVDYEAMKAVLLTERTK